MFILWWVVFGYHKTTDTVSIRIFFACTVFIWLFDYVVHRLARQHGGRKYSLSLPLLVWLLFPPHHRHTQKRATCARGQDLPFTKPFLGRGGLMSFDERQSRNIKKEKWLQDVDCATHPRQEKEMKKTLKSETQKMNNIDRIWTGSK